MIEFGRLSQDWNQVNEVIAYGLGAYAEEYMGLLQKDVSVVCIIDNSPEKYGKLYNGIPVYAWGNVPETFKNCKIVVMAETIMRSRIKAALVAKGLEEYKDFTDFERFYTEWAYKVKHIARLLELHTAVTMHCTFNCKKCNMLVPYHKQYHEKSVENMMNDMETLFQRIDFVHKYQIIGGEPFLFKSLEKYVHEINAKYKNKIGFIRIITNGSVLPDPMLLEEIRNDGNIEIHISDYTNNIKYENKLGELKKVLESNGISYKVLKSLKWRDSGSPTQKKISDNTKIKKHMDLCGTSWHGLEEGKIYYCNCSWSAEATGLYKNEHDDYLELKELNNDQGWQILQLCLGDMKKDYNSYCAFCGGCGEDNSNFVVAGEQ